MNDIPPYPPEPEFYLDDAGETRWRLRAINGRIIADSGEGYRDEDDARHGWHIVEDTALHLALDGAPPHVRRVVDAFVATKARL